MHIQSQISLLFPSLPTPSHLMNLLPSRAAKMFSRSQRAADGQAGHTDPDTTAPGIDIEELTLVDEDLISTPGVLTPNTETEMDAGTLSDLPIREKGPTEMASLQIHTLSTKDGVIVSVKPPATMPRVPCDVVLVIDVSGSMGTRAPAPDNAKGEVELNGLSVLDLTKQAARAIVESMGDEDRVGVVTFTHEAKILTELTYMTKKNKDKTWEVLKSIRPLAATNMWDGIQKGTSLLYDRVQRGATPAIMLLTDGVSNRGNPPQGFVERLRGLDLPAPIHTFGFGHEIDSVLLQSIAEVAGGNFAFISDASMLATVFIHAMAHIRSTFAANATLSVSTTEDLPLIQAMGPYISKRGTVQDVNSPEDEAEKATGPVIISLGSLQLEQSRDILLKFREPKKAGKTEITVTLEYQHVDHSSDDQKTSCNLSDSPTLSPADESFHLNRSAVCSYLSNLAPIQPNGERKRIPVRRIPKLKPSIDSIEERKNASDLRNQALLDDLSEQVTLAQSDQYFQTWGFHYLLSLYNAHFKQLCTSFKDPGPQLYNKSSPDFQAAKAKLSDIFDGLPPPKASVTVQDAAGNRREVKMSMARYHSSSNPCFAGSSLITLAGGSKTSVSKLLPGISVWTPAGARKVVAVLETSVYREPMASINDLRVTLWHPICLGGTWEFPANMAERCEVYTGKIYSLMLEDDEDSNAHSVEAGGMLAVTLGHGVLQGADCRAHDFFGNYERVWQSLQVLPCDNGVFRSGGTVKDDVTGLVVGFVLESESDATELWNESRIGGFVDATAIAA